jgi:hypothetical protein
MLFLSAVAVEPLRVVAEQLVEMVGSELARVWVERALRLVQE